jgi:DNA helicase-2/ATP-dependent DNA helicase PcrA
MGYDAYLRQMDSQGEGGLEELAEWIHETTDGCRSSREWLRYVDQLIQEEKNKTSETKDKTEASTEDTGVNLMTIHGAKGLEYPVVFIIDANEGILPYQQAVSLQEMEEERRLFYVAMTRTGESLHISWTKERFQKTQEVSRFVREAGLLKTEKPQDEKKKKRRFWRLQKE